MGGSSIVETKRPRNPCVHTWQPELSFSVPRQTVGRWEVLVQKDLKVRDSFFALENTAVKVSKMQWIWQSVSLMGIHICTCKHRDVLKRRRKHMKDKAREAMSGTFVDDVTHFSRSCCWPNCETTLPCQNTIHEAGEMFQWVRTLHKPSVRS